MTYVEDDKGCWIVTSHAASGSGYPYLKTGGKSVRLSRFAYESLVGEIPKGLCTCHTCDVPMCINPKHMFLGTQVDNTHDRTLKGRTSSKLNVKQVVEIKALIAKGVSQPVIGRRFGVRNTAISEIARGKNWQWVKGGMNVDD